MPLRRPSFTGRGPLSIPPTGRTAQIGPSFLHFWHVRTELYFLIIHCSWVIYGAGVFGLDEWITTRKTEVSRTLTRSHLITSVSDSSSVPSPLCNDWYPTTPPKDKWVGSPLGRRLDTLSNCSPVWLDLPCRRPTSALCSSQLYSSLSSQDNFSVLRASEMGSSWMSIMQLKRSRRNHPDLDIHSSGASCPPAGISFIDFPSTYEKLTPCRDRHLMS